MSPSSIPTRRLILGPAIITFAVTLIRLVGELLELSPRFFSRAAGGPGAIIGIVWLAPLFGGYFALKLLRLGERPANLGRAFLIMIGSVVMTPAIAMAFAQLGIRGNAGVLVLCFTLLVAGFVARAAWPALGNVLFAYGLAARIPVTLVMLVAIIANWGTHYDVAPPNFPYQQPIVKWLLIGVLPQMTLWVGFTVVVGMAVGLVMAAIRAKRS